jgi:hypothetical protein
VFGSAGLGPEEIEERADLLLCLSSMAHGRIPVDRVVVASTDPLALEYASLDELCGDPLRRSLGDPDLVGDVPKPRVAVLRDAQKDLSVVREERPLRGLGG